MIRFMTFVAMMVCAMIFLPVGFVQFLGLIVGSYLFVAYVVSPQFVAQSNTYVHESAHFYSAWLSWTLRRGVFAVNQFRARIHINEQGGGHCELPIFFGSKLETLVLMAGYVGSFIFSGLVLVLSVQDLSDNVFRGLLLFFAMLILLPAFCSTTKRVKFKGLFLTVVIVMAAVSQSALFQRSVLVLISVLIACAAWCSMEAQCKNADDDATDASKLAKILHLSPKTAAFMMAGTGVGIFLLCVWYVGSSVGSKALLR